MKINNIIPKNNNAEEDWPMFHHNPDHIGETSGVIETPEELELEWKFKAEWKGSSSKAVSWDYIYVSSGDSYVYCLNKNKGELKWKGILIKF
jgi:hypothetical protein